MLSVSQRLNSVTQPKGGYVPKNLFKVNEYDDINDVKEVDSAFLAIQGMVVD